jgi:hypothetical protein
MTLPEIERACVREITMRTPLAPASVVVLARDEAGHGWEVARVLAKDGSNLMSEDLRNWLQYGRPVIQDLQRQIRLKENKRVLVAAE